MSAPQENEGLLLPTQGLRRGLVSLFLPAQGLRLAKDLTTCYCLAKDCAENLAAVF